MSYEKEKNFEKFLKDYENENPVLQIDFKINDESSEQDHLFVRFDLGFNYNSLKGGMEVKYIFREDAEDSSEIYRKGKASIFGKNVNEIKKQNPKLLFRSLCLNVDEDKVDAMIEEFTNNYRSFTKDFRDIIYELTDSKKHWILSRVYLVDTKEEKCNLGDSISMDNLQAQRAFEEIEIVDIEIDWD